MNKVEFISEGNGHNKYAHKWENVAFFDIDKHHKRQECVGECRANAQKTGNMNVKYST